MNENIESKRLQEAIAPQTSWKKWGPYLSERQWSTVREDYSTNGDAWNYFPHDHARSRAYRWGEDGLGGISDEHRVLRGRPGTWGATLTHIFLREASANSGQADR